MRWKQDITLQYVVKSCNLERLRSKTCNIIKVKMNDEEDSTNQV